MLEGLPYVAILLLLLLLLLVLFLILLFIFLFLLCESRLSTRQSKVDGTLGDHEAKVHRQKEGEHERGKGMFEDPAPGRFALNETAHELLNSPVRLSLGLDGIGGRMA